MVLCRHHRGSTTSNLGMAALATVALKEVPCALPVRIVSIVVAPELHSSSTLGPNGPLPPARTVTRNTCFMYSVQHAASNTPIYRTPCPRADKRSRISYRIVDLAGIIHDCLTPYKNTRPPRSIHHTIFAIHVDFSHQFSGANRSMVQQ